MTDRRQSHSMATLSAGRTVSTHTDQSVPRTKAASIYALPCPPDSRRRASRNTTSRSLGHQDHQFSEHPGQPVYTDPPYAGWEHGSLPADHSGEFRLARDTAAPAGYYYYPEAPREPPYFGSHNIQYAPDSYERKEPPEALSKTGQEMVVQVGMMRQAGDVAIPPDCPKPSPPLQTLEKPSPEECSPMQVPGKEKSTSTSVCKDAEEVSEASSGETLTSSAASCSESNASSRAENELEPRESEEPQKFQEPQQQTAAPYQLQQQQYRMQEQLLQAREQWQQQQTYQEMLQRQQAQHELVYQQQVQQKQVSQQQMQQKQVPQQRMPLKQMSQQQMPYQQQRPYQQQMLFQQQMPFQQVSNQQVVDQEVAHQQAQQERQVGHQHEQQQRQASHQRVPVQQQMPYQQMPRPRASEEQKVAHQSEYQQQQVPQRKAPQQWVPLQQQMEHQQVHLQPPQVYGQHPTEKQAMQRQMQPQQPIQPTQEQQREHRQLTQQLQQGQPQLHRPPLRDITLGSAGPRPPVGTPPGQYNRLQAAPSRDWGAKQNSSSRSVFSVTSQAAPLLPNLRLSGRTVKEKALFLMNVVLLSFLVGVVSVVLIRHFAGGSWE